MADGNLRLAQTTLLREHFYKRKIDEKGKATSLFPVSLNRFGCSQF